MECTRAEEDVLEVGSQSIILGGVDLIGASSAGFYDDVRSAIDEVGVVICSADECIRVSVARGIEGVLTCATVETIRASATKEAVVAVGTNEGVGRRVAGEDVVEAITCPCNRTCAAEIEVFQIAAESVGNRAFDEVSAFTGVLNDNITGVIYKVAVVACTT